ncbi:hypothetical protein GOB98_24350 [Sinorhizobium meliloti]|nr:hypothetical protein [Sinorhizobium meliloti]MDW9979156.1 hypothetical protein [Sinorhizobium meliloti]MDX0295678.1 hypothetical protein [Sinorhizobium meliloti]
MTENQPPGTPERPRPPVVPPGSDQGKLSPAARQEALIDQTIEDTFPARDAISPMIIA